ncbi:MAG: SUMF1/EgtB/PvdO family nonheme iron enzyme [Anaerolineae bacterium]|nr:SUMF1/EgtB/PvdO family nonheme iron enzyme [Anaerolineae bacterium]
MPSSNAEYVDVPEGPNGEKPFQIYKYEVTCAQFVDFLNLVGRDDSSASDDLYIDPDPGFDSCIKRRGSNTWGLTDSTRADDPVVFVTWTGAHEFCYQYGERLPTVEEWRRAAGWDSDEQRMMIYPWGDNDPPAPDEFFAPTYERPVGSNEQDVRPSGVYDMAGNVSEWTDSQEILGGSFNSTRLEQIRIDASRGTWHTGDVFEDVGFRCVREPVAGPEQP